jgi:hypothetical protein
VSEHRFRHGDPVDRGETVRNDLAANSHARS